MKLVFGFKAAEQLTNELCGYFSRPIPTKEGRETDLVDDIRFSPFYIASTIEQKGCIRVLCCFMLLTFSDEAFTSKIIRAQLVGIGAESSVPKKAESILKTKGVQLPWKKQLSVWLCKYWCV